MSARIGTSTCHCCGEPESRGGCVLGFRCDCQSRPECDLCKHCTDHHVENCSEQIRNVFDVLMITTVCEFRKKYNINIFGRPTNVSRSRTLPT